jgi:hypothetical protein
MLRLPLGAGLAPDLDRHVEWFGEHRLAHQVRAESPRDVL